MNSKDYDKVTFETGAVSWMTEDEFMSTGRKLHKPIVKACVVKFKQHD